MRSEEWWKGRTTYKAPQYSVFIQSAIIMFHVKLFVSGIISSVLSPPSGENQRGGGTSGILLHVHDKHTRGLITRA